MAKAATTRTAGISDEAVQKATGKTWAEWVRVLDKAGAAKLPHKDIAVIVHDRFGVGDWWSQMVTVGYEQAKGLREKHQTPAGYQVSRSKMISATASRAFTAFRDARQRGKWLPGERVVIRTATPSKSLRLTWSDEKTHVDVMLYPKGDGRTQVVVNHRKLQTAKDGERMKKYWAAALSRLQGVLEG